MRILTWRGVEVVATDVDDAAAQLDMPANCIVLLPGNTPPTEESTATHYLFDKRSLEAGCPPPPAPTAPQPPLAEAVGRGGDFTARLSRADSLLSAARMRIPAICASCRCQRGALAALDVALMSLREASAQGEATVDAALRQSWQAVARAVAAERAACESLPAEAAGVEGSSALAQAATELGASQEARHQAAHSLATSAGTAALGASDVAWTPLVAMEEGEATLAQLHARAVASEAALSLHCHDRLLRIASLQRHMVELYKNAARERNAKTVAAPVEMADLGEGVLVPRMEAFEPALGTAAVDLRVGVHLGGYRLAECIGSGSFAYVYRLERLADGQDAQPGGGAVPGALHAPVAALKAIERRNLSAKSAALLSSEVRILKAISHPNIVNLHHVAASARHVFLWMDHCDSDVGALIRARASKTNPPPPDEAEAAWLLSQLVDGLAYMRARRLLHRDIKPPNLLLSYASATHPTRPRLLIGDFGLARALEPSQMARTVCGSPLYMAPEVLLRHPYDAAAEMWSVGVCVHELLAGAPPFSGANVPQLLGAIAAADGPPPPPPKVSDACAALLAGLLAPNPENRTQIEQLHAHPFLLRASSSVLPTVASPAPATPATPSSPATPTTPSTPAPPFPVQEAGSTPARSPARSPAAGLNGSSEAHAKASTTSWVADANAYSTCWEQLAATRGSARGSDETPSAVTSRVLLELNAAPVAVRALAAEISSLEAQIGARRAAARDGLLGALDNLVSMLPAATASGEANGKTNGKTNGKAAGAKSSPSKHVGVYDEDETAASTSVAPAAASTSTRAEPAGQNAEALALAAESSGFDALNEAERLVVVEAMGGALRAQRLHRRTAEECRRLSASLKRAQQQQGRAQRTDQGSSSPVTSGALQFGDKVLFVRRPPLPSHHSIRAPSYVALREGANGNSDEPYFLSRDSETSLLGRRLEKNSQTTPLGGTLGASTLVATLGLPPVALGTVVHIEYEQAPYDTVGAAALGVRPGSSYGVITAEMKELNVDTF